jgi:fructose-1,6-bisphosphatase II
MADVLNTLSMRGTLICGADDPTTSGLPGPLVTGTTIGTGTGPEVDVVVDPVDGRSLLARSAQGAISVAAVAPKGSLWSPGPAIYMEKMVVNREVAPALVTECLDAPAAWVLALVARVKKVQVRNLIVFVLDRPRHADLIEEIRTAGARVLLRPDGDIAGAIRAASVTDVVDLMVGIGGAAEGVIAAAAVKSMGGTMLGRLAPQSDAERQAIKAAGLDAKQVLTSDDLVRGQEIFFAVTGITDGSLLHGVRYRDRRAETDSMILRCETKTRRSIHAEHLLEAE